MRVLTLCLGLCLALACAAPVMAGESVNLNEASAEEFQSLNGVGEVLAERIIDYRKAHDGLDSVAQLKAVKGIGPATLEDLKDKATVGG